MRLGGRRKDPPDFAVVPSLTGAEGLASATYRVSPPFDDDVVGAWRLAGLGAGALLGLAAVAQSRDRVLTPHERAVSVAVASGYGLTGLFTGVRPQWLGRMVTRHPRRVLAACCVPLAAAPVTGGRHTPLHTLAAAAAGATSVVYGPRTGTRAAAMAATAWSGLVRASPPREGKWIEPGWLYLVLPLSYLIDARIAATLAGIAYSARSLDSTLRDLNDERQSLQEFASVLRREFDALASTLRDILRLPLDDDDEDEALRGLGRLLEAEATLPAILAKRSRVPRRPSYDALRRAAADRVWLQWARRAVHRAGLAGSDELAPTQEQLLIDVCRTQLSQLESVAEGRATIETTGVDASLNLVGGERIAVVAATTIAGVVNALRHGERGSVISIASAPSGEDMFTLHIENPRRDVVPAAARLGAGLVTLQGLTSDLGGSLDAFPVGDDRFRLTLTMPTGSARTVGQILAWEQIEQKVDDLLREAVLCCTAMVAVGVLGRPHGSPLRTLGSALISTLAPIGLLVGDRGEDGPPHWPLGLAALVSAIHTDPHRGLYSGWSNAALARHAMHHGWAWPSGFAVAIGAGITRSYAQRPDRSALWSQLAVLATGPATMLWLAKPSVRRLRRREAATISTLAEIETAERLLMTFHGSHPSLASVERLEASVAVSDDRRAALGASRRRIEAMIALRLGDHDARVGSVIGAFVTVLGRRIFPAPVELRSRMGSFPAGATEKLHDLAIRRAMIVAGDVIAREIIGGHPVRWTGDRGLRLVEVDVTAIPLSTSLRLAVRPVPPNSPASAARLNDRLAQLGISVLDWDDDLLRFDVYPAVMADKYAS